MNIKDEIFSKLVDDTDKTIVCIQQGVLRRALARIRELERESVEAEQGLGNMSWEEATK